MRRPLPRAALLFLLLLGAACAPKPRVDPFALPADADGSRDGVTHTVEPGETWRILALDYYGDEDLAARLRRANPGFADGPPPAGAEVFVPLDRTQRRAFEERARARAPYNRGLDLARRGDYPGAIVEFTAATELDPRFAAAFYNLGLVYRRSGRMDLAAAPLERACRLRPRDSDYLYARGLTARDLGDARTAERCLHDAIQHDGEHLPSIYALALLLDERGDAGRARRLWRLYLDLDPASARGAEARERLEAAP